MGLEDLCGLRAPSDRLRKPTSYLMKSKPKAEGRIKRQDKIVIGLGFGDLNLQSEFLRADNFVLPEKLFGGDLWLPGSTS